MYKCDKCSVATAGGRGGLILASLCRLDLSATKLHVSCFYKTLSTIRYVLSELRMKIKFSKTEFVSRGDSLIYGFHKQKYGEFEVAVEFLTVFRVFL